MIGYMEDALAPVALLLSGAPDFTHQIERFEATDLLCSPGLEIIVRHAHRLQSQVGSAGFPWG